MTEINHDEIDLIEKVALYSDDDKAVPKTVWRAKCVCGREWYGTEERVRNMHKWHREKAQQR